MKKDNKDKNVAEMPNAGESQNAAVNSKITEKITVELSDESINAMAEKIIELLTPIMLLQARFAAADVIHTSERPSTVFRHAINEAELIKAEINKFYSDK